MSKLPYLQFYTVDWLGDESLRVCSVAARGLWMDMLCLMHRSPERGYLLKPSGVPIPTPDLARLVGLTPKATQLLLNELEDAGVFSVDNGKIYNRRMVRDDADREDAKARKQKQRRGCVTPDVTEMSRPCHADVTPIVTPPSRGESRDQSPETRDQRPEKVNIPPPPPRAPEAAPPRIHTQTWDRNADVQRIMAAYPDSAGHKSPKAVAEALYALGGTSGTARYESEREAAEWLLGRVQRFSESVWVKSGSAMYVPAMKTWFSERLYDTPDSEWDKPRPSEGTGRNGTVIDFAKIARGEGP